MASDLETRIAAAEQRLMRREQRVRWQWQALGEQARESMRPAGIALALVAGAAVLRVLFGRHRERCANVAARPSPPRRVPWATLATLALPMLPLLAPQWRDAAHPAGMADRLLRSARALRRRGPRDDTAAATPPPRTADTVDLSRFLGTWYEVARLPNRLETFCDGQPCVTYTLGSGGIEVVNQCRTRQGWLRIARGLLRVVADSGGARLKASFLPAWLRWLPVVWDDLWILQVDADYHTALLGTPRRDVLWLLSRQPAMPAAQAEKLLHYARREGYPVERMLFRVADTGV